MELAMLRVTGSCPRLVAAAPAVFAALHAESGGPDGSVQGRSLSAAGPSPAGEPHSLPGLNKGVFYPPEVSPRGVRPVPLVAGRSRPTVGRVHCLVLLVDFTDNVGQRDPGEVRETLVSRGAYPTGSMRDFYHENSYGQLDLDGTVVGWLRMPQPYTYYTGGQRGLGAYPHNTQRLVEDALTLAAQQVDFRRFDADGDLFLDGLFVVHAGGGAEAEVNPVTRLAKIWSHQWTIPQLFVSAGITVYAYCATPEDGHIGVFCHEFGHMLGLPDLYDTSYRSSGVGQWCVMGTGSWNKRGLTPSHFCAWAKARLGWVSPTVVTTTQTLRLEPVARPKTNVYRVRMRTATGSEYSLVEARQLVGFDSALPGAGLLVWRIDEAQPDNTRPGHYLVGLEQADGRHDLELGRNTGDAGDPFPGTENTTEYDTATAPTFDPRRARPSGGTITEIQSRDEIVTCTVTV